MKIGNIELRHGLVLGPMAGYSDYAMRKICRDMGADYTVSEMVSAKALVFHDKKTPLLARVKAEELPMAVQIFGREPDVMAEGARIVAAGMAGGVVPSALDINMGCPVPKITGNGEGSALMKEPNLVYEIVQAVKEAVSLPVTVKIRAGWDSEHRNAPKIAAICEKAGAAAVTVHGRTRQEYYSGKADYGVIREVKEAVSIPVMGNGDVHTLGDAVRMLRETNADGIMIARGAVGNPFLFREIAAFLENKAYVAPTRLERVETALLQLSLSIGDKGEYIAVRECRKQLLDYIHNLRGAAAVREKIALAENVDDVKEALYESLKLEEQM